MNVPGGSINSAYISCSDYIRYLAATTCHKCDVGATIRHLVSRNFGLGIVQLPMSIVHESVANKGLCLASSSAMSARAWAFFGGGEHLCQLL